MTVYHMFRKFYVLSLLICYSFGYKIEKYPLLMPNVHPYVEELYLCTPVRVNYTKNFYIVGFEPSASMNVVHHMLLYGCSEPGSNLPYWDCGEMVIDNGIRTTYHPCKKGSQIIYAWARDAPKLQLPKDMGFKVGGDSPIQYLVLQVHYAHIDSFKDGHPDNSGINLYYTEKKMPKLAGVLLLGTGGYIRPMSTEHMETSCRINEDKVLHPFAFRTHTHSLGKVVSGYRVRNITGKNDWTLIGKKDPLLPEMFYPVVDPNITIKKGDLLAARCTMKSDRSFVTSVGAKNINEMCNFYILYWTEGDSLLTNKYCFTEGPPYYYWKQDGLNNIPEEDASSLD
ncbi:peptidylglycine alpha-hydroxylating monooxygenase isoform X1 [Halyomorpha halys]|uniref:peptidylglycine alpha-hydroxylating monooxygenase isoform X1 n=1 Tax=Halyomorpha halys TaxID=286706 RepID=UPI0006D4DCB3|nr:peptidylglycine alpha-hydroxylating monooxygenase [Halyomorpha halys]